MDEEEITQGHMNSLGASKSNGLFKFHQEMIVKVWELYIGFLPWGLYVPVSQLVSSDDYKPLKKEAFGCQPSFISNFHNRLLVLLLLLLHSRSGRIKKISELWPGVSICSKDFNAQTGNYKNLFLWLN